MIDTTFIATLSIVMLMSVLVLFVFRRLVK